MRRKKIFSISIIFVFLIFFTGCSQKPDIDIDKTLEEWREPFVAASFDGESNINLRVMVDEELTEEEAVLLFNETLDSFKEHSNQSDVWEHYNGYIDIVSYDDGVLYEATKLIGENLDIISQK
ncbi:hypothetical protein [Halalkalibacter urbisdiaboli]|uniref:hypothetical protein n=1 Tax=Halalkalibacter urbisdiaboli TaxID=1960589 RepID=UPI000B449FF6|nr:hypothetical protein [Halalkalibacter urbisdiaboli]